MPPPFQVFLTLELPQVKREEGQYQQQQKLAWHLEQKFSFLTPQVWFPDSISLASWAFQARQPGICTPAATRYQLPVFTTGDFSSL